MCDISDLIVTQTVILIIIRLVNLSAALNETMKVILAITLTLHGNVFLLNSTADFWQN